MMPTYRKLFNSILNSGIMLNTWCRCPITPIYKSGGRNEPSNYRGICVSSCLGELFCSILNQRLLEHVNSLNILQNSYIGFLPKNRTADYVVTLRTLVDKNVYHRNKKKFMLVLSTSKKLSTQFGMMDFYLSYYK